MFMNSPFQWHYWDKIPVGVIPVTSLTSVKVSISTDLNVLDEFGEVCVIHAARCVCCHCRGVYWDLAASPISCVGRRLQWANRVELDQEQRTLWGVLCGEQWGGSLWVESVAEQQLRTPKEGTGTLESAGCLNAVHQIAFYEFERDCEHQTSSFS